MAGMVRRGRKRRLFKRPPSARGYHWDHSTHQCQLSPPGGGAQSLHRGIQAGGEGSGIPSTNPPSVPDQLWSVEWGRGGWRGGGVYLVKLEILGPKDKKLQARLLGGPRHTPQVGPQSPRKSTFIPPRMRARRD